jgi:hypothetical protein
LITRKKLQKIFQHLAFLELRRPFELENIVKFTVYDLENSKSTRPATRRKKQAITRPNRTNDLGCKPSPEKNINKKTLPLAPCIFSHRFITAGKIVSV